ncbi:Carbamoyltransferase HypF [Pseudovibrio axinellae]|uniref:Carbamoyltransferase HypF n=1 Tax=Pseudovibrio axinellae TaxID=989403 RepID=A0A165WA15_9HYPH|nr:carbamoyltransferase HypF [Pseudovibrio axinellae]KZL16268.1 Carbamoyltransferase HypF [Pseudovibrio axinellae]SER78479.1 Hydrogenase maturation protein, carbamoyltransferase HypF [Pseudovibrio axinellae]
MASKPSPHVQNDTAKREGFLVEGAVQGVGFRPFVYRLSQELNLTGFVQNTPKGVTIEIEGVPSALESFKEALMKCGPPQARIMRIRSAPIAAMGCHEFVICSSGDEEEHSAIIVPDLGVCDDCRSEMFDRSDRRYRYPFTNCTNCGPRYSIIKELPYDRVNTTMADFVMCDTCRAEYEDPNDRRYHAQPVACPNCGPQLELRNVKGDGFAKGDHALREAAQAVREGKILAVKGLGGFHLVCAAHKKHAVAELRRRKQRPAKPFALMYPSMRDVERDCTVTRAEKDLLVSSAMPIVLLRKNKASAVVSEVAPDNPYLGVMLPYTPLHDLLLAELDFPIVATSGNRANEPICIDEDEVTGTLEGIADLFLVHNRRILNRCDDSIARVGAGGETTLLRRARGHAPMPIILEAQLPAPTLATGGHLKNTVALGLGDRVFLSPHIGDLGTLGGWNAHQHAIDFFCRLYKVNPEAIVHDLHPDYHSTRLAQMSGSRTHSVQHHHAHALSCMAENQLQPPCLAVTWDGAGYGGDGTLWGGEFLKIEAAGFSRAAHFLQFPLPGGDAAALDPKRAALGMLYALEGEDAFKRDIGLGREDTDLIGSALKKAINCPLTSSVGRLFDAVSFLTGSCLHNTFEGQAAMTLEFIADPRVTDAYSFDIAEGVIDWRPMLRAILDECERGVSPSVISARFHRTLAQIILEAAQRSCEDIVLLTGGCFQNALLLELALNALKQAGFKPHTHRLVPANDGGLALGQIMAMTQETS